MFKDDNFMIVLLVIVMVYSLCSCKSYGNDVARVIYSEAGPTCTSLERLFVASTIKNRVKHKGFGKLRTMLSVVRSKSPVIQFSAYGDFSNSNWCESLDAWRFTGSRLKAWRQCERLSKGKFTPINNVVYFHDKSISKPRSWNNRYWKTYVIKETKHFIFYGVIEK